MVVAGLLIPWWPRRPSLASSARIGRYPGLGPRMSPERRQPHKPRQGSAGFADGSFEVGVQDGLQRRHVLHDRAATAKRTWRSIAPGRIGTEHEERVPDELTGDP